jgi:hypothetical protein
VICLLSGCGKSSSPESAALKAAKASIEDDINTYFKTLAPPYIAYMTGEDGWFQSEDAFKEELSQYNLEDDRGYFVKKCGENFSAEYNALNPTTFDKNEYQDIVKDLTQHYDYDESDIKDLAEVEVMITASGDSGSDRVSKIFACVNVKGRWYIHRPGFD